MIILYTSLGIFIASHTAFKGHKFFLPSNVLVELTFIYFIEHLLYKIGIKAMDSQTNNEVLQKTMVMPIGNSMKRQLSCDKERLRWREKLIW